MLDVIIGLFEVEYFMFTTSLWRNINIRDYSWFFLILLAQQTSSLATHQTSFISRDQAYIRQCGMPTLKIELHRQKEVVSSRSNLSKRAKILGVISWSLDETRLPGEDGSWRGPGVQESAVPISAYYSRQNIKISRNNRIFGFFDVLTQFCG